MATHNRDSEAKTDKGIRTGNFYAPWNEQEKCWEFPAGRYVPGTLAGAYSTAFAYAKRWAWLMECALEKKKLKDESKGEVKEKSDLYSPPVFLKL